MERGFFVLVVRIEEVKVGGGLDFNSKNCGF